MLELVRERMMKIAVMARYAVMQTTSRQSTDRRCCCSVDWIGWTKNDGDFVERAAGIIDRTLLNARCAARLGLIRSYL